MEDSESKGFGLASMKAEGGFMRYDSELPEQHTVNRPTTKEEEAEYMELRVLPYAPDARSAIHAQVDEWLDDLYAGRRGW